MKKYNKLRKRQKQDVLSMIKDIDEESIIKLYDSIANIIDNIKNKDSIEAIKSLARVKPIYAVQTLFYLLKEYCDNTANTKEDFIEVKKYIGLEIDVFTLVNMMNA